MLKVFKNGRFIYKRFGCYKITGTVFKNIIISTTIYDNSFELTDDECELIFKASQK